MNIIQLRTDSEWWERAVRYTESCSWIAGQHLAQMLREQRFTDAVTWTRFTARNC